MKCAFCGAECMDTVCDACSRGEVWAGSLTLDRVCDEEFESFMPPDVTDTERPVRRARRPARRVDLEFTED